MSTNRLKFIIYLISLLLQLITCERVVQESDITTSTTSTASLIPDSYGTTYRKIQLAPSKETIRIGNSNASPSELIRQASQIPGLDINAINELLRTKQPVIKSTTNDQGQFINSTYMLEADGSIKCEHETIDKQSNVIINDHNFLLRQPFDDRKQVQSSLNPIDDIISERRQRPIEDITNVRLPETWNPNKWRNSYYHPRSFDFDFDKPSWSYGNNFNTQPLLTFETTTPENIVKIERTTVASNDLKPTTNIKLEDIPIFGVYNNEKAINDDFLKGLPSHLLPILTTPRSIENIPQTEWLSSSDQYQPKTQTSVRTYHRTFITDNTPKQADLDPNMREVLRNANINPDLIPDLGNGTKSITKTRTEPDGRVITTKFTIKSSEIPVPVSSSSQTPSIYSSTPTTFENLPNFHSSYRPTYNFDDRFNTNFGSSSYTPTTKFNWNPTSSYIPSSWNPPTIKRNDNHIDEILLRNSLTKDDIKSKNGEVVKTFIDDDGNVLTMKFILSSPKSANNNNEEINKPKPLK